MVVAVKRTEVAIENLTGLLGSVTRNGNDRGNANGNGNGNFLLSGNYPYPMFCYKEHYHPKCDVCKHFIPTNAADLTEYRAHPFWVQKYCPFHEHDGTPWCCSCERMEDKIAKKLAEQSQPGVTNPQSESQAVSNSEVVALKEVVADQAKLMADYAKKFETMMLFMASKNGVDPATIPGLISSKENGEDTSIGQEDGIST
ncbi:hypothetical protein RHGRI_016247 [Rhododendron griersonianum]|uniref:Uncharacterized protein n=1 Tax=Rhododendron griersonianum TaxID=479676 RepID=A0AAV6JTH0_9ERIC|nr:hypothetical protein RHGRI_016247 [Rhododendron griersonianum]